MIPKNISKSLLVYGFLLLLIGCSSNKEKKLYKINGSAQGTYYAIAYFSDQTLNLQQEIDSLLSVFDNSVSSYKSNSIISRLNNNDSTILADEIYQTIFEKAQEVSKNTAGAFDITVGPLVNAWGFGFSKRQKVTQALVDSLLPFVGYQKVKLINRRLLKQNPEIRIDFDAIAQGYSSDWLGNFLESRGISSYLIDIGGEVVAKGEKPDGSYWTVGIEMPAKNADDERKIQSIISLKDKAISTSGSYRKYYEEDGIRFSHTIDPKTGYPVRHNLLSVSVLAGDCITADAYATAFMVMGVEKSREFLVSHPELNAYFISDDNQGGYDIYYTKEFESLLKK